MLRNEPLINIPKTKQKKHTSKLLIQHFINVALKLTANACRACYKYFLTVCIESDKQTKLKSMKN